MKKILLVGGSKKNYDTLLNVALHFQSSNIEVKIFLPKEHIKIFNQYFDSSSLYGFFESLTGDVGIYDVKAIHNVAKKCDQMIIGYDLEVEHDIKRTILSIISMKDKEIIITENGLYSEILKIYNSEIHNWTLQMNQKKFEEIFQISFSEKNLQKMRDVYNIKIEIFL